MIVLKSSSELDLMRKASHIVARTHEEISKIIRPGVTTEELDKTAEEVIIGLGGKPAFKGYKGFPASICASVNEEVVHGIPGSRVLKSGDIISIDIGVIKDGFYGDGAKTHPVGEISEEAKKLIDVTTKSFYEGIKMARSGNRLSDISHAIQSFVESNGCSVVRDYVGHGIGREMHEEPQIPNFGPPGKGPRLKAGMTLAIEPMVNLGKYHVKTLNDNWTVITVDGSLSAHYEHTVVITEDGVEILTQL